MNPQILVIDDEQALCEILRFSLEKEGYRVKTANSADEAMLMDLTSFALFIVDIMMDGTNGFDFAQYLRSVPELACKPLIFCSVLDDEDDKVKGLNIGADDYITKPFSIAEVIARVRAVLRRTMIQKQQMATEYAKEAVLNPASQRIPAPITKAIVAPDLEPIIKVNGLSLDPNTKGCVVDGRHIRLTRTEYGILLFFMTHRHRVYSRDEIIRCVWDDDVIISERTIDTNITRLRKRLGSYGKYIRTRPGFGYVFDESKR